MMRFVCYLEEKRRRKCNKTIKSALGGSNLRLKMPLHLSCGGDDKGDTGSSIISTNSTLALGVKKGSETNQINQTAGYS